jgi:hypothetical protein
MVASELFNQYLKNFLLINPTDKNRDLYIDIKDSYKNFEIIDHFSQLKNNAQKPGLAFELMFFNSKYIIDFGFTSQTMNYSVLPCREIKRIFLGANYNNPGFNLPGFPVTDYLTLRIFYGDEAANCFFYETEMKRFSELLKVKNNLLRII